MDVDRRVGPSRLSTWSGRRVAALWIIWPGSVLAACGIAVFLSIRLNNGLDEVRVDLTRSNMIGVVLITIIPPALLTFLWWRMRRRRQPSDA